MRLRSTRAPKKSRSTAEPSLSFFGNGERRRSLGNDTAPSSEHPLQEPFAVQPKLRIGQPNDKYEQEADRMADQVMGMPEPAAQRKPGCVPGQDPSCEEEEKVRSKPVAAQITPFLQREIAEPGNDDDEDNAQAKSHERPLVQRLVLTPEREDEAEEPEPVPAKRGPGPPVQQAFSPSLGTRIRSLKDGGQPLTTDARSYYEPRFGFDFGQVRVHADEHAAGTAEEMNARAFTVGQHVVFGAGEYSTDTHAGRRLLAHELTHVVQQSKTGSRSCIQRNGNKKEPTFLGKPLSYWRRKFALQGMPARVRKYIDKPIKYSGKRPLTATILFMGIAVVFDDGGLLYVDRSRFPLNMHLLETRETARRKRAKAKEKWYQTLLRWVSSGPTVRSSARWAANWELSDRLWIIQKLADGWTVSQIMQKKKNLDEQNFQVIALSATVIPIISGSALFPAGGGPKAPVRTAPVRGTAARALERAGLPKMAAQATARHVLRQQGLRELAKARARGGPIVVNIGGKGEQKGAINLNPNTTSVEKNPTWPNWISAGGEDIAKVFPPGSVDKVISVKLPGGMNWTAIVNGAKQVLKPKGMVQLNQWGPTQPIVDALTKAGFKDIKVIGEALVTAVKP